MTIEQLAPREGNRCFGCGGSNPRGLKLSFALDREAGTATAHCRLAADYQGADGIAHGGMVALLLDEAMAKLQRLHGVRAVTAELTVRYRHPVPIGVEIVVTGVAGLRQGRNLHHRAEIRDSGGELLASAEGRFVVLGDARPSE